MLRKARIAAAAGLALALGVGTAALAGGFEWQARPMIGANEVPAVASGAEARASFEMDDGVIHYKLRMRKPIKQAFMAHIHAANVGVNGPIVVWLFGTPPAASNPPIDFGRRAVVAEGDIHASDLVGPLAGKTLDDLMALLNSGGAYVNMHTIAHPGGEIRAQVTSEEDD